MEKRDVIDLGPPAWHKIIMALRQKIKSPPSWPWAIWIYTHLLLHAQIQNHLRYLLSAYAFFATKYQIAARNYSACNNHHVILRH